MKLSPQQWQLRDISMKWPSIPDETRVVPVSIRTGKIFKYVPVTVDRDQGWAVKGIDSKGEKQVFCRRHFKFLYCIDGKLVIPKPLFFSTIQDEIRYDTKMRTRLWRARKAKEAVE